jgi:hypothetical protein
MPTDPAQRQRRNRASTAGVVAAAPAREGKRLPPLGRTRPDATAGPWHPETRRWWRTIWSSAIADRWVDAHVPGLRALARLVDDYWRSSSPAEAKQLHAEIRMASREFGLSPMAARSMGWEFRRPKLDEGTVRSPLPPGADPRKVLTLDTRRTG